MKSSLNRPCKEARQGAILICILVCLAIVTSLIALTVQSALRDRREMRTQHYLRQAELLLTAGIQRAKNDLQADNAYEGGIWQLSPGTLPGIKRASVEILESPAAEDTSRKVRVIARLSVSDTQTIQRSYSFLVESQLPNGKE